MGSGRVDQERTPGKDEAVSEKRICCVRMKQGRREEAATEGE
jgi:hypothetical protein